MNTNQSKALQACLILDVDVGVGPMVHIKMAVDHIFHTMIAAHCEL